jgi:SAM-dependent methyltransferase
MLANALIYTGERMVPEYADSHTFWEHVSRYAFVTRWVKGQRVLDIASGEGYGCEALLKAGAKSVIGVDIDEQSCAHAVRKYNIDARVGDAENIPVETGSIDVVVSFETIEHVPNPRRFMHEILRVLSPDGMLIISTPDKSVYHEGNPFHCSEMTSREFQSLIGEVFPNVTVFGQHPHSAKWWNPLSLISDTCQWDSLRGVHRLRRKLWSNLNGRRLNAVPEEARRRTTELILHPRISWLERILDLYAIRSLGRSCGWSPIYIIAVAYKGVAPLDHY